MTFSIVAVDKKNKEIGFAIASCTWNAGVVGTSKAELGAICSQAQGYYPFHRMFYEGLENGLSLDEILETFREKDAEIENRQVGMISFTGEVKAFTGKKTGAYAGHIIGDDYACQGNILTGRDVLEAMSQAFENSEGILAERMYSALQAGDDIGGDIRGKMSARVLVKKKGSGIEDTEIDLTIEDHDEPVQEIGRLLAVRSKIYTAYMHQLSVMEAEGEEVVKRLAEMEEYLSDKIDRTVVDYHYFVAEKYLDLGMNQNAINSYRNVLKISPGLRNSLEYELQLLGL